MLTSFTFTRNQHSLIQVNVLQVWGLICFKKSLHDLGKSQIVIKKFLNIQRTAYVSVIPCLSHILQYLKKFMYLALTTCLSFFFLSEGVV